MSVRRLSAVVLALVVGLLAAVAVLVAGEWAALNRAQQRIDEVLDPAALIARQFMDDYVDQETGERSYIITGDAAFLAPYERGIAGARRDAAKLRSLLADERALVADVDVAVASAAGWLASIAPELRARAAGRAAEADALVATGTGKAEFARLRANVEHLQQMLAAERSAGQRAQAHAARVLSTTLVAALALLFATVLALTVAAWRAVVRPLGRLRASLHTVSGGAVHLHLAGSGPEEIVALGRDAELMRGHLVEQIEAAEHATEALLQQAPAIVEIRRALAPSAPTGLPAGLEVHGEVVPAEGEVAGDWWDVIVHPDGRVTLVLADITGHGTDAALLAVALKAVLCSGLRSGQPVEPLLEGPARDVFANTQSMFATAVIIDIDLSTSHLTWANCGHPAPLLIDADGQVSMLHTTGGLIHRALPVATLEHTRFRPGALLFLYSDGLSDARDAHRVPLRMDTLVDALRGRHAAAEACAVARAVLQQHTGTRRHSDDVTLLAAYRGSSGGTTSVRGSLA
ncbi:MAG TPA: SpoIIE family protein phosphatase [Jatrophihabitans sp.]|jgi:sigma-B regulation protein RsbU (phosphoserine phosphatase)